MRKRLLILVVCAAIVASLVPSNVWGRVDWGTDNPILIDSFSAPGTTVDYLVEAWTEGGQLRGLTAVTVRPGTWTTATVKIAAGVAVTVDNPEGPNAEWYTWPQYAGQKSVYAGIPNGVKTDMVYAPNGFAAVPYQRIYLRMLLASNWLWPPLRRGTESRCWTWRSGDSNLARDYWTEQQLEAPEAGFAVIGALLFINDLSLFL